MITYLRILMPSQIRKSPPSIVSTVGIQPPFITVPPIHTIDIPSISTANPSIFRITPIITRNSRMIKAILSLINCMSIPIDCRDRIGVWELPIVVGWVYNWTAICCINVFLKYLWRKLQYTQQYFRLCCHSYQYFLPFYYLHSTMQPTMFLRWLTYLHGCGEILC